MSPAPVQIEIGSQRRSFLAGSSIPAATVHTLRLDSDCGTDQHGGRSTSECRRCF